MTRSWFALIAVFVAVASSMTSAQLNAAVETIDLGMPATPAGATELRLSPVAINAHGAVAGSFLWSDENGSEHMWAFTWTRGRGFTILMTNAAAIDINDHGDVVGYRYPCPPPLPEEGNSCDQQRGSLWSTRSGFVDLGDMIPSAINNARRIVGHCADLAASCLRVGNTVRRLARNFVAADLNERNVLAGTVVRFLANGDIVARAAVWMASTGVRELDRGGPDGRVFSINEAAMVAGTQRARDAAPGVIPQQAAVWTLFGGAGAPVGPNSEARAISDRGWVVGLANGGPALWRIGGRLLQLPTPRALSGTGGAVGVNDAGEIVGSATTEEGENRGYLWIVR
jgi:hypothetical protein